MNRIHTFWSGLNRREKVIWGISLIIAALAVLALLGSFASDPAYTLDEARYWSDMVTYVDAAHAVENHTPLYELQRWSEDDVMAYHYHPFFALLLITVAWLPFRLLSILWILGLVVLYILALRLWYLVLVHLKLPDAQRAYWRWLPVAFVFTEWFANMYYGNITCALFCLSGALTLALLQQRTALAIALALIIALLKPQWLFPLLIPLFFREWRLLGLVLLGVGTGYITITGLFILIVGIDYGVDTLRDYVTFLTRLNEIYPWRGQTGNFEDYNYSWRQILHSYFGFQDWVPLVSEAIKAVMLLPILGLIALAWRKRVTIDQAPFLVLWVVGLGYLWSMALLPQLWEVVGSLVFFIYIQSIKDQMLKRISWVYLIYIFHFIPDVLSFIPGLEWLFLPKSTPLPMVALLWLYGILLKLAFELLSQQPDVGEFKAV
jgi:hypothetical protein